MGNASAKSEYLEAGFKDKKFQVCFFKNQNTMVL